MEAEYSGGSDAVDVDGNPAGPDGQDAELDTFDFTGGAVGLSDDLARQLEEAAQSLSHMDAEQRRHLIIAMSGVAGMYITPFLAARRRRRRRNARARRRAASPPNAGDA